MADLRFKPVIDYIRSYVRMVDMWTDKELDLFLIYMDFLDMMIILIDEEEEDVILGVGIGRPISKDTYRDIKQAAESGDSQYNIYSIDSESDIFCIDLLISQGSDYRQVMLRELYDRFSPNQFKTIVYTREIDGKNYFREFSADRLFRDYNKKLEINIDETQD